MGKAILLALVLLGMAWYQLAGPGAPGNSPRGTARAFTRALAAADCAERLRQDFPAIAGAGFCTPEVTRGLRTRASFFVTQNDGNFAIVDCFYGSACGRNRPPCRTLRFELVNHGGRWRLRSVSRDAL